MRRAALMYPILVMLCTLAFFAGPLHAADPLILTDAQREYILPPHLDLLPDPQDQYTIEDVSTPSFAERFVPAQSGDDSHSAWARLTLKNETAQTDGWVLMIGVRGHNRFDLYIPDESGGWTVKKMSDQLPFVQWEVKYRYPAHRLILESGQTRTVYLHFSRLDSESLTRSAVLRSAAAFAVYRHDEYMALGIYYGIVAVMMLYNLFVFLSLRDRAYLYYVMNAFVSGLWFATLNGIGQQYLWPEVSPWPFLRLNIILIFSSWILFQLFIQAFLHTRIYTPRIHRYISIKIVADGLIAAMALIGPYQFLDPFYLIYIQLHFFLVLALTIVIWRRGYRPARYFLLSWSVYIAGVFLLVFSILGLVPTNFFTTNSIQIGHALEFTLLSLALADRINILRGEKEREEEASRQAELRAHTAELQTQTVEKELQTAQNLQMGLMPTTPPQIQGFDIAGRCLPASRVGGDFFQFFQQDGKLSICLADVTGHAMEAAVPVMMFSGVLETEMQYGHSIERLLTQLNRLLHRKLDRRTFVCFTIGEVDLSSKKVRLANGGCPYPFHYRATTSTVAELPVEAYPLGVREETNYPVIEAQLALGDRLVFCSDGLVEAQNGQEEMFGFDQLAETIRQGSADNLPAGELIDRLIDTIKSFAGTAPQGDDMTCVVLRVGDNLL